MVSSQSNHNVSQSKQQYSTTRAIWNKNDEGDDDTYLKSSPPSSTFATKQSAATSSTTTDTNTRQRRRRTLIPRKAAVKMTDSARNFFLKLLHSKPEKDGILLDYHQSSSGEPRMVYSFRFVTKDELVEEDEGYVCSCIGPYFATMGKIDCRG
jgi:hypothetical protein